MFKMGKTDVAEMLALPDTVTGSLTLGEKRGCKVQLAVNSPGMLAGLESFDAGSTYDFAYWYEEAHIVVSGSATIRCTLPPFHQEIEEVRVGPGDIYQIEDGARLWFEVDEGEPFVHYFTVSPNPFYVAPAG